MLAGLLDSANNGPSDFSGQPEIATVIQGFDSDARLKEQWDGLLLTYRHRCAKLRLKFQLTMKRSPL